MRWLRAPATSQPRCSQSELHFRTVLGSLRTLVKLCFSEDSLLRPPTSTASCWETRQSLAGQPFLCLIFWLRSLGGGCWPVLCVNQAPAEFLSVFCVITHIGELLHHVALLSASWQTHLTRPPLFLCGTVHLCWEWGWFFLVTFQPSSILNYVVLVYFIWSMLLCCCSPQ